MPDVLIRGMAMPDRRTAELMRTELACVSRECDRHCENCDLVQDKDELIVAFREAIRVLETVANAVPLPEGHGRLGDLTEIEKKLQKTLDGMGDRWLSSPTLMAQRVAIVADLKKVKEAPTIIPAEGGGAQ